jgi:23S rRNA (uracil1939-C5)-methyltransferase
LDKLAVNQAYKIIITSWAAGGEGVGRLNNLVCFVPFSLPGEQLRVKIEKISKNYIRAQTAEILKASPERVPPPCPIYYRCGGCQLQHIEYQAQLKFKQQIVLETLQHLGGLAEPKVKPILGAPSPWHYRSKVQVVLAYKPQPILGLYQFHTHKVVPMTDCAIQEPLNNEILQALQGALIKVYGARRLPLRYVLVRTSASEQAAQLTLISKTKFNYQPLLKALANLPLNSVWLNLNPTSGNTVLGKNWDKLAGQAYLYEQLGNYRYRISPAAFFQVHPAQALQMIEIVLQAAALQGQEIVLDAYCGVGLFSLPLAAQAKRLIGIEALKPALKDAQANAAANNLSNTKFYAAPVEVALPEITAKNKFDLAVLDPPRKGCDRQVLEALTANKIARIIYVSCNVATLARDIKYLIGQEYKLKWVQPVDLFPQTAHIETITLLEHKG